MDTIFALASAPGKAGVSIIRVSGPMAWAACERIAGSTPPPRKASLRKLHDRRRQEIDEALVLSFDKDASFTGEMVVEFQIHGSVAIQKALLGELGEMSDLRMAEPGEFTRRALENGRLDLTQVEALGDLIEAETESQRRQAMRVFSGALGDKVELWRTDLIRAAALLEAVIDFADEDVPVDVSAEVSELLERVCSGVSSELRGTDAAERVRTGFEVAILGAPNVGKSTLLNALAGREAAITSEIAGTTRDVIEVRMEIGGLPVTLLDTAGLRETEDPIERIGVARAQERARNADLRVYLVEDGEDVSFDLSDDDLVVGAKADIGSGQGVSGLTGAGIEELLKNVNAALEKRAGLAGLATRERHRIAFRDGLSALGRAMAILDSGPDEYDICAEEIRSAIRSLERLVGRIDVENLLGEIFSSFCIGK